MEIEVTHPFYGRQIVILYTVRTKDENQNLV